VRKGRERNSKEKEEPMSVVQDFVNEEVKRDDGSIRIMTRGG